MSIHASASIHTTILLSLVLTVAWIGSFSTTTVMAWNVELSRNQQQHYRRRHHHRLPLSCHAASNTYIEDASTRRTQILEQNLEYHRQAIAKSENLFYGFNFTDAQQPQRPSLSWQSFPFPSKSHYKGADATPPPPFTTKDLCRVSREPILTPSECQSIIDEAENLGTYFGWHSGARYGTPMEKVGAILPLEELSTSYTFINFELLPQLFSAMGEAFPCLGSDSASSLRLGGGRIVRYDATRGQTELGYHRDGLLLTANIALNDPTTEYTGGGTLIEALSTTNAIRLPLGHALVHPGDLRHCACPITSGKRYVLVLFLLDIHQVPHDRYCAERGERDWLLAQQTTDTLQKEKLLQSSARHFSDAMDFGARIDDKEGHVALLKEGEQDLSLPMDPVGFQKLLRSAARHLGAKTKSA